MLEMLRDQAKDLLQRPVRTLMPIAVCALIGLGWSTFVYRSYNYSIGLYELEFNVRLKSADVLILRSAFVAGIGSRLRKAGYPDIADQLSADGLIDAAEAATVSGFHPSWVWVRPELRRRVGELSVREVGPSDDLHVKFVASFPLPVNKPPAAVRASLWPLFHKKLLTAEIDEDDQEKMALDFADLATLRHDVVADLVRLSSETSTLIGGAAGGTVRPESSDQDPEHRDSFSSRYRNAVYDMRESILRLEQEKRLDDVVARGLLGRLDRLEDRILVLAAYEKDEVEKWKKFAARAGLESIERVEDPPASLKDEASPAEIIQARPRRALLPVGAMIGAFLGLMIVAVDYLFSSKSIIGRS